MYKPESVQENEMHEIIWDFEIQTDYAYKFMESLINQKKRTYQLEDFVNFSGL